MRMSLRVDVVVTDQEGLWNVVRQPLGLPIFLATTAGVLFYGPLATRQGWTWPGECQLWAWGGASGC